MRGGYIYLEHRPQEGKALLQLFFRRLQGSQTVGAKSVGSATVVGIFS